MSVLLLILLLLPGVALAKPVPCQPDGRGPCTPSAALKKEILRYAQRGIDAQKEWEASRQEEARHRKDLVNEQQLRRSGRRVFDEASYERKVLEWEQAYTKMKDQESDARVALKKAMELSLRGYRIDLYPAGPIEGGPSKGVRPVDELQVHLGGDYFDLSAAKDGSDVHVFRRKDSMSPEEIAGVTFFNGRIVLTVRSFQDAVQNNNPGEIAITIYHEMFHRLTLTDGRWYAGPPAELQAYGFTHDAADAFELPPGSARRKFTEKMIEAMYLKVHGSKRSLFKNGIAKVKPPRPWDDAAIEKLGLKPKYIGEDSKASFEKGQADLAEVYAQQEGLVRLAQQKLIEKAARDKRVREAALAEQRRLEQHARTSTADRTAREDLVSFAEAVCNGGAGVAILYRDRGFARIWKDLYGDPHAVYSRRAADSECARRLADRLRGRKRRDLDAGRGNDALQAAEVEALTSAIRRAVAAEKDERDRIYNEQLAAVSGMFQALCRNPDSDAHEDGLQALNDILDGTRVRKHILYYAPDPDPGGCFTAMTNALPNGRPNGARPRMELNGLRGVARRHPAPLRRQVLEPPPPGYERPSDDSGGSPERPYLPPCWPHCVHWN